MTRRFDLTALWLDGSGFDAILISNPASCCVAGLSASILANSWWRIPCNLGGSPRISVCGELEEERRGVSGSWILVRGPIESSQAAVAREAEREETEAECGIRAR